jgi:hypothetical protein
VNCDRLAKDEAAQARLAEWRGWAADYSRVLAAAGVCGLHESRVCFPVADAQGVVIGRHVFQWPELGGIKAWYAPGINAPLVIGAASLEGVRTSNVIESQWDALALLNVRGWKGEALEKPFIVTRGTSISPMMQTMLAGVETVLLWMQHDEPKAESLPVVLKRVIHLGKETQAELQLDDGRVIHAQLSAERAAAAKGSGLANGARLHVLPRSRRRFG